MSKGRLEDQEQNKGARWGGLGLLAVGNRKNQAAAGRVGSSHEHPPVPIPTIQSPESAWCSPGHMLILGRWASKLVPQRCCSEGEKGLSEAPQSKDSIIMTVMIV